MITSKLFHGKPRSGMSVQSDEIKICTKQLKAAYRNMIATDIAKMKSMAIGSVCGEMSAPTFQG